MTQLIDFVLISGFAIISVIIAMLWFAKKRELPQKLLIAILSTILIIIVTLYTHVHGLKALFVISNLIEDGARFLLAPLIYLYVKSIFVKEKNLLKGHLVHFLPFLLYWLFISVPVFVTRLYGEHIFGYLSLFDGTSYKAIVKDLYLLLYIFYSAKLLTTFENKMKNNYSSFKETNSGWLKNLLIGFLLVTLFDLLVLTILNVFDPNLPWDIGLLSLCFLILTTIYLGYQGLRQSKIYLPEFLIETEAKDTKEQSGHAKLVVSEEEFQILKTRLEEVMSNEKPYLLQELTLNMLADKIKTTDKKLSVALNQYMQISFYDLINQYRIEAVKDKLQLEENDKYSLLGIAYNCGFNSKSSFYRAFKKETGISPTTYKKVKID